MANREQHHGSARRDSGVPRSVFGLALIAAVALAACKETGPSSATHPATTKYPAAPAPSAPRAGAPAFTLAEGITATATALTCTPTGAHGKHLERNIACATCHPCGYGIQIVTVTFPGGTTSAGSIVDRSSGTATCTTGCHAPLGATPTPVAWNAGPLACTFCHNSVTLPPGVQVVSSHPGLGTEGATCTTCHDTSAHTSGVVHLVGGVDSTCQGCHSGTGSTLLGITPPLVVGWTTQTGDFHGARAGQGFGGTLLTPYTRNYPALTCTTCHDAHASGNPFLFAKAVNGAPMSPGAITRAGVGAEQLCERCHVGDRHAKCALCHLTDPKPAGSACFTCHTHEGTLWFPWPGGSPANYHDQSQNTSCDHCHGSWERPIESTPPVILYAGNEQITVTPGNEEATIYWETDEGATSFIEYGLGDLGFVAGDAVITNRHTVRLTGLTANTTYSYRIRTSDVMRNVKLSAVRSFTTLCPTCLPVALVVANANFDTPITATTEQSGAWWRDASRADYCGTYASTEMTGSNVFRIAATPREYLDWDTGEFYWEDGYGMASYGFPRADLDAGDAVTFDVRPKYLAPTSTVSLLLVAFDASGAVITDTLNYRHVFDIIGVSSPYASSTFRIASPAVNTTYAMTVPLKTSVTNGLADGKTWADVAKVWLVLQATSGYSVDVYFDNFR